MMHCVTGTNVSLCLTVCHINNNSLHHSIIDVVLFINLHSVWNRHGPVDHA